MRYAPAVAKAAHGPILPGRFFERRAMVAIAAILLFVVVIGGLNFFEFGRLD